jgi:DNA-directed RNA polymerase specialized sigma24 family protein
MALNEAALAELVRTELPAIYSFSFRLSGNAPDAERLCQAVFSAARQKYPDASLTKIAISEWKRIFHDSRKQSFALDGKNPDAATRSLNTLSHDDKIILILRDVQGKTPSEVAELLGVSANGFKSRLAHAREAFRQVMLRPAPGKRP